MACNAEAVKLATFINNHTPMLASDPILSHLVAAKVVSASFQVPTKATPPSNSPSSPVDGVDSAFALLPSTFLITILLVLIL